MNELEALVILSSIPQLGSIKIRLLIQNFGSAVNVLNTPLNEIGDLPGFGPKIREAWEQTIHQEAWKKELAYAHQIGTHLIAYTDPLYPKRLLEISDYPLILYTMGSFEKSDQRCLAIVGTRNASLYGLEMAKKLSCELAEAGFTIISGLARGIDTAAHQGALETGRTVAILGSGLAQIYPAENQSLARVISERGALMSEFSIFTPPDRTLFPQRNRIISGMSMGTILIEAPVKSGSMITMNRALKQNRPIFALPGRADLDNFKGNHALIKERKALLIENSQDVIQAFDGIFAPAFPATPKVREMIALDKEETDLMKTLPQEELSIDDILRRTQLPIHKLHILLMSLVLKNVIKEYPGKIYKKL